jgi:hypothetical protein
MPSDRDSFRRNRVAPVGAFRIAPLRVAAKFPRLARAHNSFFLREITRAGFRRTNVQLLPFLAVAKPSRSITSGPGSFSG